MFEILLLASLLAMGMILAVGAAFVASLLLSLVHFAVWLPMVLLRVALLIALAPFRLLWCVMNSDARVRR